MSEVRLGTLNCAHVLTSMLLAALVALFVAGGLACRDNPSDGDADSDGDVDGDGDSDGDVDGDGDGDPCPAHAGGECNPILHCGCSVGEMCNLVAMTDHVEEVCEEDTGGTGQHEEPCDAGCAEGYLGCFDPGICLKLCTDSSDCPERSMCDVPFTLPGEIPSDPYMVCSPRRAEADASYVVCTGAAGVCPNPVDGVEREISSNAGHSWSCTVDITSPEQIVLNFEISDGTNGIAGTNLVFPVAPSRLVPVECDSFVITEGGVDYSPTTCMRGLPDPGTCVVSISFNEPWLGGNFRCSDVTGDGTADLLTTMNGSEAGAGAFNLRACDYIE